MKFKWIPVKKDFELNDMAIVTRQLKRQNGQKFFDVTIGFPGWGLQNGTVAYMPFPKNINEDPAAWESEYRGDELPNKNIACLVQLQAVKSNNDGKLKIIESYYLAKEKKFLRIPNDREVIAWMEHPKPYRA